MRFFLLATLASVGCSDEPCLIPPCAEPIALEIAIATSTGAAATATVAVSGAVVTSFSCSAGGTCPVPGSGGTYTVDVTATGFAPVHKSIQVTSTPRKCSCEIVQTQDVQITLVPAS